VYNRKSERWRLFGDISQERRVRAVALGWLESSVVVCSSLPQEASGGSVLGSAAASAAAAAGAASGAKSAAIAVSEDDGCSCELPNVEGGGKGPCQLLVFPKSHLDFSSLVASHSLPQRPLAMDCIGGYVLIAHKPLQLQLFQLVPSGSEGSSSLASAAAAGALSGVGSSSSSSSSGGAKLQLLRELVLCNVGRPLLEVALVLDGADRRGRGGLGGTRSSSSFSLQGSSSAVAAAALSQQQQQLGSALLSNSSSSSPVGSGKVSSAADGAVRAALPPEIPGRCVVLRCGGLMSVLDLTQGTEITLSADIECFWLSDTLSVRGGGGSHNASAAASGGPSRSSSTHAMEAVASSAATATTAIGAGATGAAAGGGGGAGASGQQLVAALARVRVGGDAGTGLGPTSGTPPGRCNVVSGQTCYTVL
jgi:hypothetical protein